MAAPLVRLLVFFFVAILGLAQVVAASNTQASAMVSSVATLVTTFTLQGESIPIYEYERVNVEGDLPLQDFRGLINAAEAQLTQNERIEALVVTKYNPLDRTNFSTKDSDYQVHTCQTNCTRGPDRGASGRLLLFARTPEGFRLSGVMGYIE